MARNSSIENLQHDLQNLWEQACQVAAANGKVEFDGQEISATGEPSLEFNQLQASGHLCQQPIMTVNEGLQRLSAIEANLSNILPGVNDMCRDVEKAYQNLLKMDNKSIKHTLREVFADEQPQQTQSRSKKANLLNALGVTEESYHSAKSARQTPKPEPEAPNNTKTQPEAHKPALDDEPKGPKGP